MRRLALVAPLVVALTLAGCGGKDKSGSNGSSQAARPTTPARIQILEPTPNQETGPDVTVKLNLIGARIVPQSTGPIRPDEGHIHVSLDGQVVNMTYTDVQTLTGLTPGQHSVQVDFV
ncbi:MAG TPA: hypothetical protein VHL53_00465, partial [Acidimicrobiia bacterium]|nr:hypothetical protein [Acidimicrobiia bacterium]